MHYPLNELFVNLAQAAVPQGITNYFSTVHILKASCYKMIPLKMVLFGNSLDKFFHLKKNRHFLACFCQRFKGIPHQAAERAGKRANVGISLFCFVVIFFSLRWGSWSEDV